MRGAWAKHASGIDASDKGLLDAGRDRVRADCRLVGLLGLAARPHVAESSRRQDGHADEDGGADATDGVEAGAERRTGRVEQFGAQRIGQLLSCGCGSRDALAGGGHRLGRDAGGTVSTSWLR